MRTKRVLLHVGTPKTGTSHLQEVLYRNQRRLSRHGIHYPADRFDAHFLAALDLMRLPWGGLEAEAVGRWDRLAARVRQSQDTTVISHEILATATRSQVAHALDSLGQGDGAEIHILLSVRDLVRQIPAEWQENVKHRSPVTYARFLRLIQDPGRSGRIASWFWGVQEIPDILDRWGHDLPPDRVHLITVPPPGAPADQLWSRFSEAFGLDGLDLDLGAQRVNPSLGVPETALIRRINRATNKSLAPPDYRPLVRELIAHQTLSGRTSSPRLALPPDLHPWAQGLSRAWVAQIEERGYDVVGDLADLLGGPPVKKYADPDRPAERLVAAAAVEAIKALLLENARLRHEEGLLGHRLHEARAALEHGQPSYRYRELVVRALDSVGPGRALMALYRRARGRSSRSA